MTDITGALATIQQEEVDYRSGISEALLTKIGAAINYLNQNAMDQVGDVKASFLTEAQFQSQRGSTWVLCDGRSVAGSDYETLTGNSNIPDMRGNFFRMKDHGRSYDPQGDSALETERTDIYKSHNHTGTVGTRGGGSDDLTSGAGTPLSVHGSGGTPDGSLAITINNNGSSETAPKHIVGNVFIKINE